jgi:hypothetical protein
MQRPKPSSAPADPVAERRAVELDTFVSSRLRAAYCRIGHKLPTTLMVLATQLADRDFLQDTQSIPRSQLSGASAKAERGAKAGTSLGVAQTSLKIGAGW